jgi:predicted transcriptional regulator
VAATTTLRVRPDTRDRLNRLAREDDVSAPELIDQLVEKEEEDRRLAAMNADFERLRDDEHAWADFKTETAEWDTTSSDAAGSA